MNPNQGPEQEEQPANTTPEAPQSPQPAVFQPTSSPSAQPPAHHKKNKAMLLIIVAMGIVIALAIAFIIVLMANDSDKKSSNNTQNSSANSDSKSEDTSSSVAKQKDIVTVDTQESGVSMTITGINKSGNTLTVSYKFNNNSSEPSIYASSFGAGVYAADYKAIPEPYFISDADNQKYGLVKDSSNNPLASKNVSAHLKKGESVSGFFTLTLPPNNSTGSLVVGNVSIPNVTIKY